jgi:hypothetical protein
MATPLLPDALWNLIRLQSPNLKVEDHACQIALASKASCSFCEAGFLGGCCHRR